MSTTLSNSSLWNFSSLQELEGFRHSQSSGALWQRPVPEGFLDFADSWIELRPPLREVLTPAQVAPRLLQLAPTRLADHPCCSLWVEDVSRLCHGYCSLLERSDCLVHLDYERPCQRFHADNLEIRLVCAYRGPGTLWLPPDNLNLEAAEQRGTGNEDIVRRSEDVQQLSQWDVLLMKGKKAEGQPLYHRSPPPQLGDPPSLLLKLDESSFL